MKQLSDQKVSLSFGDLFQLVGWRLFWGACYGFGASCGVLAVAGLAYWAMLS